MKKYYLIVNNVVAGVSSKKINSSNLVIESDEIREIGDSYIDGVFGEPIKTYSQELSKLNEWKRQETDQLAVKFATILLINGTHQSYAEEGIRQSILTQLHDKYDNDLLSIKEKYGVI